MSDDDQIQVPHSFIQLFIPPGSKRPNETRAAIAARYELCEDMAQMLTEPARARFLELGVTEQDILVRMQRGLQVEDSVVTQDEARWVVTRLAELLDWPMPSAD